MLGQRQRRVDEELRGRVAGHRQRVELVRGGREVGSRVRTRRPPPRRPGRSAGRRRPAPRSPNLRASSTDPAAASATGPSAAARTITRAPRRTACAADSAHAMSSMTAANTTTMSSGPTHAGNVVAVTTGAGTVTDQGGQQGGVDRRVGPDHHQRAGATEVRERRHLLGGRPDLGAGQRRGRQQLGDIGRHQLIRLMQVGRHAASTHLAGCGPRRRPPATGSRLAARRLVQQQHRDPVPDREDPAALGAGQRRCARVTRRARERAARGARPGRPAPRAAPGPDPARPLPPELTSSEPFFSRSAIIVSDRPAVDIPGWG